jgi:hypothetical protein
MMHRLGLIVVLSVTLMRPGQPAASLNGSEPPIYFSDAPCARSTPTGESNFLIESSTPGGRSGSP